MLKIPENWERWLPSIAAQAIEISPRAVNVVVNVMSLKMWVQSVYLPMFRNIRRSVSFVYFCNIILVIPLKLLLICLWTETRPQWTQNLNVLVLPILGKVPSVLSIIRGPTGKRICLVQMKHFSRAKQVRHIVVIFYCCIE